jgi:hypothetical protein
MREQDKRDELAAALEAEWYDLAVLEAERWNSYEAESTAENMRGPRMRAPRDERAQVPGVRGDRAEGI